MVSKLRSLILALPLLSACEQPVPPADGGDVVSQDRVDTGPPVQPCTRDQDCNDGLFCNGLELCRPGAPLTDERGCGSTVAQGSTACGLSAQCTESLPHCQSPSCPNPAMPDEDGDGDPALGCAGGTDCDDHDPMRAGTLREVCDLLARDEDCNPCTVAAPNEGDRDGDGAIDRACANRIDGATVVCSTGVENVLGANRVRGTDCNDADLRTAPGRQELCNLQDDDCDELVDEGAVRLLYPDHDGDGFGASNAAAQTSEGCAPPSAGLVENNGDCNDDVAALNPRAVELCDPSAVDENCDGLANPASDCACLNGTSRACTQQGLCAHGTETCSEGHWGPCSVRAVAELCNELDDDCDGSTDEDVAIVCYTDRDNDGYADGNGLALKVCNTLSTLCPTGTTGRAPSEGLDCDDTEAFVHPGAAELCNGQDDNCDGLGSLGDGAETEPCKITQLSAGATHVCALRGDNSVTCWGSNAAGQTSGTIGQIEHDGRRVALPVAVAKIATGAAHSCALGVDHSVWCWGSNALGQLGNTGAGASATPVQVAGLRATDLASSVDLTCAVTELGELLCWGSAYHGELGNGMHAVTVATPTRAMTSGPVQSVYRGPFASCAKLVGGELQCWGDNSSGQLGIGTQSPYEATPRTTMLPAGTTVRTVYLGTARTIFVRDDRIMLCAGANNDNLCSSSPSGAVLTPELVSDFGPVLSAAHFDFGHLCALEESGLRCKGQSGEGLFASGLLYDTRSMPAFTAGPLSADFLEVVGNNGFYCGRTIESQVYCWGNGEWSQFGDGRGGVGHPNAGGFVAVPAPGLKQLAVSSQNACGITAEGDLWCWGAGGVVLGPTAMTGFYPTPRRRGQGISWMGLAAGRDHLCGLDDGDKVYCWGTNESGELGRGTVGGTDLDVPAPLAGAETAVELALGPTHSCLVDALHVLRCWGDNSFGQIGIPPGTNVVPSPTVVPGIASTLAVAVGPGFTCAVSNDGAGTVLCFGTNDSGQLGTTDTGHSSPQAVLGLAPARKVIAGERFACALLQGGEVYCWGSNLYGQLGEPNDAQGSSTPRLVNLPPVADLYGGEFHACARLVSGGLECWGLNYMGQVNPMALSHSLPPTPAWLPSAVGTLEMTNTLTCGVDPMGMLHCQGSDPYGLAGEGRTHLVLSPMLSQAPWNVRSF